MLHTKTCLNGMVTAPHHLAAQAGVQILREGGNAIEAMVAAAATIAVVYPHMNGLGGDGFWLISEPGCEPVAIQACGQAAQLANQSFYDAFNEKTIPTRGGHAALTVAGAVGGWALALQYAKRWGKALPLSLLLEDAIWHASQGIVVSHSQAELTRDKWEELKPVLGFAQTYANQGLPKEGSLLKQAELACSIEHLGKAGLDDFYRGEMAHALATGLEKADSPLRREDLYRYHAQMVKPLSVQLNSGRVYNLPPPTQGVSSLIILALFERLGISQAESFSYVHGLVEATKRAFILRNAAVADPNAMDINPETWLSSEFLDKEVANINMQQAASWPHKPREGDTIWMGAADSEGRVVSYIQSIYWEFGSGVVVPDTGILWQNRGASFTLDEGINALKPGKLPFHTLNPALALLNDGRTLAYGTMGGEGQPQTQAAIYTRYVMYGEQLQAAITAPRWLLGRTWGDVSTNLKLENRFDSEVVSALRQAGHEVQLVDAYSDMMGHAGAVCIHKNGLIEGSTDPRADGICAAF